jgi:hypothetical protein
MRIDRKRSAHPRNDVNDPEPTSRMGARPSVPRKLSMRGSRSPKQAIRLPVLMRRATLDSVEGLRDRINHRVVAMGNLPSSIPLGQNE